jgi:hypothetical protein
MKMLLTTVALLMFGVGMTAAYMGHHAALTGGIIIGFACLGFANLDQISKFKASATGFEIEKTVAQAKSAIVELQDLGVLVAKLSLSLVKRQGRWGTYSDEQQDAIREDVNQVLKRLGVPERKIQDAESEWHDVVEFDYVHAILGGKAISQVLSNIEQNEKRALLGDGFPHRPTSTELRAFLSDHDLLSPEREELIKDYDYYRNNRVHRRPDVWKNRRQLLES